MAYGVDRYPEPEEGGDDFEVDFDQVDGFTRRRVYKREREPEPIIPPDVSDARHSGPGYLRPQLKGPYPGSRSSALSLPEGAHD